MAQQLYEVDELPKDAISASAAFYTGHLKLLRSMIGVDAQDSLVIVLPRAPSDHRDWRRALARDLARSRAPARVNVIAGGNAEKLAALLHYLASAKSVTGQYLETHE